MSFYNVVKAQCDRCYTEVEQENHVTPENWLYLTDNDADVPITFLFCSRCKANLVHKFCTNQPFQIDAAEEFAEKEFGSGATA